MRNSEQASRDVLATADRYFEAALVKSGVTSKGEIKRVKNIFEKTGAEGQSYHERERKRKVAQLEEERIIYLS